MAERSTPSAALPVRRLKRLVDIVLSAAVLVALSPVLLAMVAAMWISYWRRPEDRGPIFYLEPRISGGRLFNIIKFRTVKQPAIEAARAAGGGRLKTVKELEQKRENLTWAGGILKATYLDELPQILNILAGEMTIVGPRPWPEEDYRLQLRQGYNTKGVVPCGLTGLVQCNKGRGLNDVELDLEYIEAYRTKSALGLLWLDATIVTRSLRTVLEHKGI